MLTHTNQQVRRMPTVVQQKRIDSFWSKVAITANVNCCWEWQNFTNKGYGTFKLDNGIYYSHRVSYFLHNGYDPLDKQVCHKCDNRKCCNPHHLFLGTNKENYLDSVKKNRSVLSPGEKNIVSKSSEEQVYALREECEQGNVTYTELSKKYNVTAATIIAILNGTNWKHLKLDKIKKKECRPKSQDAKNAKLTNEDILNIKSEIKNSLVSYQEIADKYNVSPSNIAAIYKNKTWKGVGEQNLPAKKRKSNLNIEVAKKIRIEYANGDTSSLKLAKKYLISKKSVLDIIHNKKLVSENL